MSPARTIGLLGLLLFLSAVSCRNAGPASGPRGTRAAAQPDVESELPAPVSSVSPAQPTCDGGSPGPCESRWWSDLESPPLVYEYSYEAAEPLGRQQQWAGAYAPRGFPIEDGFRLVEERVRLEGSMAEPTRRRFSYDANGFIVREDSYRGAVLTHVAHYQNDEHGNRIEVRSAFQEPDSEERFERHVLELDAAGRTVRDERWAEPDGTLPGYAPVGFSLRSWSLYEYDAEGRVIAWSEHDSSGVRYSRTRERDEHGNIVLERSAWSSSVTETVYLREYDECGRLTRTDKLDADGGVTDRWTQRFDCTP